jgi:hypothetical protein
MRDNRRIGAEASLCPTSTETEYKDGGDAFAEYSSKLAVTKGVWRMQPIVDDDPTSLY